MKTLKSLKGQYKSLNDMGRAVEVHPYQLSRLIMLGAYYKEDGSVFIPSKTKLKL